MPTPDDPPDRLLRRWDLGDPERVTPLGRHTWRMHTSGESYLLREHTGDDRRQVTFRHTVMAALAGAGLPVRPPLPARTGRTLVQAAGRRFALYPWTDGRPRGGLDLSLAQCHALGGLLGRLHAELDRLTPPVQQSLLVPAARADDAIAAIDRLLAALPADGHDFDALAARRLAERRSLLAEYASYQPPEVEAMTAGYVHGELAESHLRYGPTRSVVAVLGWDGMRIAPYAGELVQAGVTLFAHDDERGLDLGRVESFVRGHAEVFPLDDGQVMSAVHRLWWERLCDLAPLRGRYLDDDRGVAGSSALVTWWTAQLDHTLEVFAAPYAPGRVADVHVP